MKRERSCWRRATNHPAAIRVQAEDAFPNWLAILRQAKDLTGTWTGKFYAGTRGTEDYKLGSNVQN